MARSRKYSEKINNVGYDPSIELTPDEQEAAQGFPGPGYYARTNINDVINNFIVSHVGGDKILTRVPRTEVAYWAQRGVQEFNYDILQAEKTLEFEMSENRTINLPSDFVSYVELTAAAPDGVDIPILKTPLVRSKTAVVQDGDYNTIYDDTGEFVTDSSQNSIEGAERRHRFRSNSLITDGVESFLTDDIYDYYYSGYFGRRYGLDPQFQSTLPTFYIDRVKGRIHFDDSIDSGTFVTLKYISDGLQYNDDLSNVFIPKMAEDALYAYILYHLAKLRPTSAQVAPLYQKEMRAKMRNAKIRLSEYRIKELAQVFRGRAKWIKH